MTPFTRHTVRAVLLLLAAAVLAYAVGGVVAMLVVVNAVLVVWLSLYLFYMAKLLRWLQSPKLRMAPEGFGVWDEVFKTLLLQAKSRKKRKQKLGMALQRFNRAAEAMPNGVIILNREGRIEWMNHLAASHLNLDVERDWMGILPNLLRAPEFHQFLQQPLDAAPRSIKISVPCGKQRQRVLALTRSTFEARAELLITQDISAAEQLNATRTAFVANVSHELRTPLTVINGFLETMADMPALPTEQQQQFIGLMQKEGQRMLNLLADLLTLSRLESHSLAAIETQPINLSALVGQLLQEAQTLSKGRHHISHQTVPDIWVEGIQTDLYSALSNLVFNAVRYTPEGGNIDLTLARGEDAQQQPVAVFSVRDSGPGIAAEHIPRLTERFYRVDAGRSRQSGGTGLGLAITKHALAEHQGTLDIQSEVGVGSTFSAIVPLKAV
ncbi:phosphate regulon sensor histidine kinase PhoR [Paralysiella testudinis]|uniref:Phosphate regulon sensor protein PhoR n=1 Tax=Paralysiella testudinis TaxID=2809020 RepID=A0A892ZKW1_9NEIS|nr:phosphate regulon sensor histidine kinase PhoR [Paralysiella testudinis]QRQ82326.1 phosphate regulon sensor histidine kinase PhoR [Paralysiella testudinis]